MRAFGLTDDLSGILSTLLAVLHLGGRVNGWRVQKWGIPNYGWIWSGKVMISHDKSSKMDQKVAAESVKIWVFWVNMSRPRNCNMLLVFLLLFFLVLLILDLLMSLFLFLVLFFFLLLLFLLAVVVAVCMYSFFRVPTSGASPFLRQEKEKERKTVWISVHFCKFLFCCVLPNNDA